MAKLKGKYFPYGVHVKDMKSLTANLPIETLPMQDELVIPLSQHIGAPATPIVEVGETVKKGQMIAKASGFISAPVYSAVRVRLLQSKR